MRDAHNRKMSKSLGNVIDPLDVINGITLKGLNDKLLTGNLPQSELKMATEFQKKDFPNGIPTCGADSLRFTLLSYVSESRSINLDVLRIEGYRKWCNKMWNTVRFAHKYTSNISKLPDISDIALEKLSPADMWILSKLNKCVFDMNKSFENYDFMSLTSSIYQFWTVNLCDFYIVSVSVFLFLYSTLLIRPLFASTKEMIKPVLSGKSSGGDSTEENTKTVLLYVINQVLKLLHPIMPYITEELYQRINTISSSDPTTSIMIQDYPTSLEVLERMDSNNFDLFVDDIRSIRSFLKNDTYKKIHSKFFLIFLSLKCY